MLLFKKTKSVGVTGIMLTVCLLFLTAGLTAMGTPAQSGKQVPRSPEMIIGTKIYQYTGAFAALFRQWEALGINTAFISESLAANKTFMQLARHNEITTFVIVPMFCSPGKAVDDSLYARNGKGGAER